ncbi:MAG: hypothetical protein AAGL17_20845, partial [Cyanobacteria bacterium J06576_12]
RHSALPKDTLIDFGSGETEGQNNANQRIFWESTVTMAGAPSPEVVVNAAGEVEKLVNATVQQLQKGGQLSGPLAVGDVIAPDATIVVGDIAYSGAAQSTLFKATDLTNFNPLSIISGYAGKFKYDQTYDSVDITNFSDRRLLVNDIDVVNRTDTQPKITIDLDRTPKGPVPGTFPNSLGDGSTVEGIFNFAIEYAFNPTDLTIQSLNPTENPATDILLNGTILNPVGITTVRNTSNDIFATKARDTTSVVPGQFTPVLNAFLNDGRQSLIRTNQLAMDAAGAIGSPTARLNAGLIQFAGNPAQVNINAKQDIFLDFKGRQRALSSSPTVPFVIDIANIQTPGSIDLRLQDSIRETGDVSVSGVLVNVVEEGLNDKFISFFRPDKKVIPALGVGALGSNP